MNQTFQKIVGGVLAVTALMGLSACGSSEPNLMTYAGSREGPDEFLVVPAKPLETPPKPGELPPAEAAE